MRPAADGMRRETPMGMGMMGGMGGGRRGAVAAARPEVKYEADTPGAAMSRCC